MLNSIKYINKEQALPEFISGGAGNIEFDFIEGSVIEGVWGEGKESQVGKSLGVIKGEWLAIVCHPHPVHGGTKDNKVVHTLCRAWRDQGVHCLRFNFRGVGKSEGVFDNGRGEYDDLCSVIDFVQVRYGRDKKILLSGFSFGAYIAAKYASKNKVDALVLVAPPVQYTDFVKSEIFTSSTLVVQGDADDVVSYELVITWFEEGKSKSSTHLQIEVLKEAGHFFHGRLPELKKTVQEFYYTL